MTLLGFKCWLEGYLKAAEGFAEDYETYFKEMREKLNEVEKNEAIRFDALHGRGWTGGQDIEKKIKDL